MSKKAQVLGLKSIFNKRKHGEYKALLPQGFIVLEEYYNAHTKILHKHLCGYEWKATPNTIIRNKACPICNISGFNINKIGYTYLIYFPRLDLYKVGVSNNYVKRLKNLGYDSEIILIRKFEKGRGALLLEKLWLHNLKDYIYN